MDRGEEGLWDRDTSSIAEQCQILILIWMRWNFISWNTSELSAKITKNNTAMQRQSVKKRHFCIPSKGENRVFVTERQDRT